MTPAAPPASLEQLLQRQKRLAWGLSAVTLGVTLIFFGLMGTNTPWLGWHVGSLSLTAANLLAGCIIVLFLLAIMVFGHQANRIDALKQQGGASNDAG